MAWGNVLIGWAMGEDIGPILGMGAIATLVIVIAIFALISSNKRKKALQEFATANGFTFFDTTYRVSDGGLFSFGSDTIPGPPNWLEALVDTSPFGIGHSRRISSLILGEKSGLRWAMFDYRYTTGSGKHQATHSYGIVLAWTPYLLPRLTIGPENFFTKIGNALGLDDIQFESEEFNREYRVNCDDRKRAYDIVHPLMIEFLLGLPKRSYQFGAGHALVAKYGSYQPMEYYRTMEDIIQFFEHLPDYVKEETKI